MKTKAEEPEKAEPFAGAVIGGEAVAPPSDHFSGPRLEVTVRFVQASPPYVVGQLLELPEKTAKRLIRAGTAVKDKSA